MKINRIGITRAFTILISSFILLFVFPLIVFASSNYGDGAYGGGNYNEGDITAPVGGSVTYIDGYYTTASVSLTIDDGSDSVSGINTSTRIIQRKSASLSNNECGTYDSYLTITPTGTYPSFTDSTVSTSYCYQYQYLVSDNAGNQTTYTSSSTVKVDTTAPVITLLSTTLTATTAKIVWTTNEASSSQVEYGVTTGLGTITNEIDTLTRVTNHIITLSNLNSCKKYYYHTISKDWASNSTTSSISSFTTLGCSSSGVTSSTSSSSSSSTSNVLETVTIKVTDSNGNPVNGAKVELGSGLQTVYTNSLGLAIFSNVTGTTQEVTITYGNISITRTLDLLEGTGGVNNNFNFTFALDIIVSSQSSTNSTLTSNTTSKSNVTNTSSDNSISPIVLLLIILILLGGIITFFFFRRRKID